MRSMYDLMEESETRDSVSQELYPDIFSAPLHKFKFESAPQQHSLTQGDLQRIDILMNKTYGNPELDDIVLSINGIGFINDTDTNLGKEILLPRKENLEKFYSRNYK
jgi:hypothetical protein